MAARGQECVSCTSKYHTSPLPRKIIQISMLPRKGKFFSGVKFISFRKDVLVLKQHPAKTAFPPFTRRSQDSLTLITYFLCHLCLQTFLTLKLVCGVLENLDTRKKKKNQLFLEVLFCDLGNITIHPRGIIK